MVGSVANDGATNIGAADSMDGTLIRLKAQQKKEEAAKSERSKASIAQIEAAEGGYSKPAPEFKPTAETASGLMGLMSLVAAAGGILGGKGRTSGLMAINAASGMMEGYNKGRSELYEQQRQMFDEHMKSWEQNRKLVKEAFDRALRIAPTNLTLAQETLNRDLIAMDLKPLAAINKTSGPMAAHAAFSQFDSKLEEQLKPYRQKLGPKATLSDVITEYEAQKADERAKAAAEIAALEKRKKVADVTEAEAKASRGGKTEAQVEKQIELQNIAEGLKANNKTPTTEKEIEAWQATYKDQPFPVPRYGLHAFIDSALGAGASSGLKDKDLTDIKSSVDAINQTNNILKKAQDPEIKFGSVPTLWENIKQKWRANFDGMGLKDNAQLSYNSQLPNGQTVGDYLADEIRATPVDPNDKNAVFQKEAAFTALAVERAARGGSMLPLGFIKTLGPLLDPKQYTRKAYSDLMAGRVGEIETSLGNYQFSKDDINKLLNRSGQLMGTKTTEPAAPSAPAAPVASLKDIEFTAQKYGKTVDEIKKILRNAGRKIEGE